MPKSLQGLVGYAQYTFFFGFVRFFAPHKFLYKNFHRLEYLYHDLTLANNLLTA